MHHIFLLAIVVASLSYHVHAIEGDPFNLKAKPLNWKYCDEEEASKYALQISDLKLEPNPPKKGEKVKISVKGKLASDVVAGAKLTYSVKLGIITLAKKTTDLCDTLASIKDKDIPKCPVKAGELSVTREQEFPSEAPAGKYSIEAEAVSADGKTTLLCIKADLVIPLIAS